MRRFFAEIGTEVKIKTGVETFDETFRETVFRKEMPHAAPSEFATYCDEVYLLFGITGQTIESMRNDIEIGFTHFERVCINIMTPNTANIKPDYAVIKLLKEPLYDKYINNPRVDILLENIDFRVGGEENVE